MWGGGGLKNYFVDFSVKNNFCLTCLILAGKSFYDIMKLVSTILDTKINTPSFLAMDIVQTEICSGNVKLD